MTFLDKLASQPEDAWFVAVTGALTVLAVFLSYCKIDPRLIRRLARRLPGHLVTSTPGAESQSLVSYACGISLLTELRQHNVSVLVYAVGAALTASTYAAVKVLQMTGALFPVRVVAGLLALGMLARVRKYRSRLRHIETAGYDVL